MSSIPIPPIPTSLLGAGSQTVTEEDKLAYMEMPTEMSTFDVNSKIYEWDESHDLSQCKAFLEHIHTKMLNYKVENANLSFVVQGLDEDNLAYLNTLLGEGEVSAIINQKEQTINIQESIFTGLWRITIVDLENRLISDCIEVGDIPEAVVTLNQHKSSQIFFDSALLPESVINAPAILTELKDKRQEYEVSNILPDAINLTLLPHTEEDLTAINNVLGLGDTVILSRGYGNCRITSTGISAIWWVKYFNSTDNEILSTIEITNIPIVACAAPEDIQDSTERLKEFSDEL